MMAKADDTAQRLLEAAGEVFGEKGFEAATVKEICERARANIAAVNYHFGGKDRLYAETLKKAHCLRLEEPPPLKWPEGTPPEQKLRDWIRVFIDRAVMERADPPWFLRLMLREMFQPSPAGRQLVEEFIRPIFRDLQAILTELLPAAVPEQRRHLIGFSIVGQCIHHKLGRQFIRILVGDAEAAGYDADVLTDHIYSFSLAALRGVGAAAGGPAGERP